MGAQTRNVHLLASFPGNGSDRTTLEKKRARPSSGESLRKRAKPRALRSTIRDLRSAIYDLRSTIYDPQPDSGGPGLGERSEEDWTLEMCFLPRLPLYFKTLAIRW